MSSGFEFSFSCSDFPRLAAASSDERSHVEVTPLGIHWPDVDGDFSIAGLLRDHAKREQDSGLNGLLEVEDVVSDIGGGFFAES